MADKISFFVFSLNKLSCWIFFFFKKEAVEVTWNFSLNDILTASGERMEQLGPVHLMYTDKIKAQTDEKSTTEISPFTVC